MADHALERDDVLRDFKDAVNMTPNQLKKYLDTDESKSVGITHEGDHESVGHESGRRIIKLLDKKKDDLTDDDLAHMKKVVGYVHRHLKQKPDGDVSDTRWRYSLMNWGHDPLKDK
ncbi:hypothetical protein IAD21_05303 [Abditibacteriota bacterium]|nr:hypothetical protein IAD21_05303 [Abditibacteriota bacterium]